jgi:hypothetical protein
MRCTLPIDLACSRHHYNHSPPIFVVFMRIHHSESICAVLSFLRRGAPRNGLRGIGCHMFRFLLPLCVRSSDYVCKNRTFLSAFSSACLTMELHNTKFTCRDSCGFDLLSCSMLCSSDHINAQCKVTGSGESCIFNGQVKPIFDGDLMWVTCVESCDIGPALTVAQIILIVCGVFLGVIVLSLVILFLCRNSLPCWKPADPVPASVEAAAPEAPAAPAPAAVAPPPFLPQGFPPPPQAYAPPPQAAPPPYADPAPERHFNPPPRRVVGHDLGFGAITG